MEGCDETVAQVLDATAFGEMQNTVEKSPQGVFAVEEGQERRLVGSVQVVGTL